MSNLYFIECYAFALSVANFFPNRFFEPVGPIASIGGTKRSDQVSRTQG